MFLVVESPSIIISGNIERMESKGKSRCAIPPFTPSGHILHHFFSSLSKLLALFSEMLRCLAFPAALSETLSPRAWNPSKIRTWLFYGYRCTSVPSTAIFESEGAATVSAKRAPSQKCEAISYKMSRFSESLPQNLLERIVIFCMLDSRNIALMLQKQMHQWYFLVVSCNQRDIPLLSTWFILLFNMAKGLRMHVNCKTANLHATILSSSLPYSNFNIPGGK